MKRSRFSEEQIVRAIQEHDQGKKAEEICRELGVSQASFYTWKKQYEGLGIAELRELRQLREENGRLNRLVADLTLDRQILQGALTKKV
jgi:putative transposase